MDSSLSITSSLGNVALIDNEIRSFSSSIPKILTFTCWPGSNFSLGEPICLWSISEIWTKPCTAGAISTNAPKLAKRTTVPSITSSSWNLPLIFSKGVGKVSLIDNEIRSESFSTDLTLTFTLSPTDTTCSGDSTCSCDSSETWTKPSTPPISMKAPKLVKRATLPSITSRLMNLIMMLF